MAVTDFMGQLLTRNFLLGEYACKCGCGLANPHPALAVAVQELRDDLGVPITISGPCRCHEHNLAIGGARTSYHLPRADMAGYCCAADLQADLPLAELVIAAECVEAFEAGGIFPYIQGDAAWLHVDVRGVTGFHRPWSQGCIDGRPASVQDVLLEDERRRALRHFPAFGRPV